MACSKRTKKAKTLLTGSGLVVELLPISNREVGATSTGDGLEREYKAEYKTLRRKRIKEMGAMTQILIEDGMKVRKLPGPVGMGAVGTAGMGAVGIVGFAVALDSLGMSVMVW